MSGTDLLAVCPGPPHTRVDGCTAVETDGLTLWLGPRDGLRARMAPRHLARAAAARARRLETLLAWGPMLPALAGQRLDARGAIDFVRANRPALDRLLARIGDRVQVQVSVAWDPAKAPGRFGHDLDRARRDLAARIGARLEQAADEVLPLPVAPDGLLNRALLLPRTRLLALDAAVEEVDAIWTEGLAIRQIGPMPPVSFVSLALRRVAGRDVAAARARLGLTGAADDGAIEAARKALLRAGADPGETAAAAGIAAAAARLGGGRAHGFPLLSVWSEDRAGPAAAPGPEPAGATA